MDMSDTTGRVGRSRWVLVAVAALAMGLVGTYQFVWSSVRLPLGAHLGAPETALGTVFTVFLVFQAVSQFPAGWVRDRFGPRIPLLAGAPLVAVGYAWAGVAESLPAAVESADLDRSAAFRRRVGTDLFLVTRVTDPDERVAVLLVGAVDCSRPAASDLASDAREAGVLYSHVELLDGTHLATFRHDHPADFLPEGR